MIGKVLGNRYEILEKVGSGGMADVYKAHCKLLDRYVAIKILKKDFSSDQAFVEKFKRESLAVAKLSHHKIVNIYDVGEEENQYYIVMEFAEGKTLKDRIQEKGYLKETDVISITLQIAEALKHAHLHGIVHRDIKPQNIIINNENNIKVADFGIARTATQNTVNFEKDIMGSVHYSSPEQAKGRLTDEKSDLYSLGIVMYEMATGILPFEGESPIAVAYKQIKENVNFPEEMQNLISGGLKAIILKAVEKDQTLRYQTAEEIIHDLQKLKENRLEVEMVSKNLNDMPTMVIPKVTIQEETVDETMFQTQKITLDANLLEHQDEHEIFDFHFEKEEEQTVTKKGSKTKSSSKMQSLVIPIIAVVAAFVLVLVFTISYFNRSFKTKEIEVPQITGYSLEEAKKILEEKGLELEVDKEIFDLDHEEGAILDQSPKEGMHIKTGVVHVVVSKGAEMVEVPNLLNMTTNQATIDLEKLGLGVGNVDRVYSDMEVGYIVEQVPVSGTLLVKGTLVDVKISKGEEQKYAPMPNLISLGRTAAEAEIVNAGFTVGEVTEGFSNTIAAGLVMEQGYREGMEVSEGTKINFVISKGPEPITDTPTESPTGEGDTDTEQGTQALIERELLIRLPEGEGNVFVSIRKVLGETEEIIYEQTHDKGEKGIRVTVKDQGLVRYKIYFDDIFSNDYEMTF